MFDIYDGRAYFKQWDADMMLIADELPVGCEVNFENDKVPCITTVTEEVDGKILCEVPNILLQYPENLRVSAYLDDSLGKRTTYKKTIAVIPQKKPPGYVYTKTEAKNYSALEKRVQAMESDTTLKDTLAEVKKLQEQCQQYAVLCNQILQDCQQLKNEMEGIE